MAMIFNRYLFKEQRKKLYGGIRKAEQETGINRMNFSRWERGVFEPNRRMHAAICRFFRMKKKDLFINEE